MSRNLLKLTIALAVAYLIIGVLNIFSDTVFVGNVPGGYKFTIDLGPINDLAATSTTGGSLTQDVYYFRVYAVDANSGISRGSNEVTCTIGAISNGRCSLSWSAATYAASYRIYKGLDVEDESKYKTTSSTSFNWDSDSGATTGNPPQVPTAAAAQLTPTQLILRGASNGQMLVSDTNGKFTPQTVSASGANTGDSFITVSHDADLTAERIVASGAGVTATDGGANSTMTFAWTPDTFINNLIFWDGSNSSRTLTANLSGTDPVITFGSSSIDITTGTLKQGGTAVVLQNRALTGGAGIAAIGDLSADRTISTDSSEADFLGHGALTCGASTQGKMLVHTTPLQYCDNAATPTLQYAAYGDSSGNAKTGDSATAFFSSGQIGLAQGGTNADLSGTGGAHQVLKQSSSGANVTVGQLACSDLSDAGTGCSGTTAANHNLLSSTHTDTVTHTPVRGDMIVANSTPAWAAVAKGSQYTVWTMGASDPGWGTVALDQSAAVSGVLPPGNISSTAMADDKVWVGDSSSAVTPRALSNCTGSNKAETYDASTNSFGCNTISAGTSSVTISGSSTGDALPHPVFNRKFMIWQVPDATVTTCTVANGCVIGGPDVTLNLSGGTLTNTAGSERRYFKFVTTASNNCSPASTNNVTRVEFQPKWCGIIKTDSSLTNTRITFGVGVVAVGYVTTLANSSKLAVVGYSNGSNSGNFYCETGDGTTLSSTDIGLAAAASTIYRVCVDLTTAGHTVCSVTPSGGSTTSLDKTSNQPPTATDYPVGFHVADLGSAAKTLYFGQAVLEQN